MPGSDTSSIKTSGYGAFAWFAVVSLGYLILLFVLAGPHFFGHKIKAGDISQHTLRAPNRAFVIDDEKTRELAEAAKLDVYPILVRDKIKSERIYSRIKEELTRIGKISKAQILPISSQLSPEEQVFLLELDQVDYKNFLGLIEESGSSEAGAGADAARATALDRIRSLPSSAVKPARPVAQKKGKKDKKDKKDSGQAAKNVQKSGQDQIAALQDQQILSRSQLLERLEASRKKYSQLRAAEFRSSPVEKELLLIAALLSPDKSDDYLKAVSLAVENLLSRISLHPHSDRGEWEEQLYQFLPDRISPDLRHRTASFLVKFLEANVSINQGATEAKQKNAAAAVAPVMKEIKQGAVIVRRGDTLTEKQVETLKVVGIRQVSDPGLATVIAISLFASFLLFGVFLYTYETKLFYSPSSLALMSTVSIISCVIALFIGNSFPQFVPIPATTLILTVVYKKRLSAILTVLILLFLSVSDLINGPHLAALAAAALMALVSNVKRRKDLMPTGILIGMAQSAGYAAAVFLGSGPGELRAVLAENLPLEMLGGLISAIAAIGSLPFLENIFGILTPYRIAELAEPDQPLMQQLEENAPGTYQHSLAVANLAEGGARAIGADVNLVHTGAMYHDIGKMVTPRYFIENQLGDKNPHDFIAPEESRAKVLAHVTNGLALAQKYGLPKAVQAFIPEHQGTTVMAYFYHKAAVRDGAGNVDINDYRYPGPKPQTKESAIVMLADVSEAVTHSMKNPSMEEVETAIKNVFKARWDDEQFSESGLTLDELEKVRKGFVRVWRTLHHDRLKYPSTTTGRMPVVPNAVHTGLSSSTAIADPPAEADSSGAAQKGADEGNLSNAEKAEEAEEKNAADQTNGRLQSASAVSNLQNEQESFENDLREGGLQKKGTEES